MEFFKEILNGNTLAYIVSGFIGLAIVLYITYNTISFYMLKEKYHGIHFTTKNISYITMMIGVNVSVVIVISQIFPITVIPSIRLIFEGLMVKITGFIFGPIVGFIVGLITEALTLIFIPSYIHPAFLITIISFGFISGIGSSFLKIGRGSNILMLILINVFLIVLGIFMYFVILNYNGSISVLGFEFSKQQYSLIFIITILLCIFLVWGVTLYNIIKRQQYKLNTYLPIFLISIAQEYLVVVLITPWGDSANFGIGAAGYTTMMVARLFQVPFKLIINTFILTTTYKIVNPLVRRDW